jgi:hypothetical protein
VAAASVRVRRTKRCLRFSYKADIVMSPSRATREHDYELLIVVYQQVSRARM